MASFSISSGNTTTFTDTTPDGGTIIDFDLLDNSFSVQVNGVDLFVGGPSGSPNEAEFQANGTSGRTVRFADGDEYGTDTPQVWQLGNTNGEPIVRLEIKPDGTIQFYGVKTANGPLEPLELYNGLTVNSAAIAAAWNDSGSNTIVIDQEVTGPTHASGDFSDVPCFVSGTLIETIDGPTPVEMLAVGDKVLTFDNGYRTIRWLGCRKVTADHLEAMPRLKPVLIRADALGAGFPKQDLVVSPQHRVMVSSAIAMRMFGARDVLVPANKLLPLDGVTTVDDTGKGVEYWHILFDRHEIVWSNGTPTESLFTGQHALRALSDEARLEIETLFPEICTPFFKPVSARPIPKQGKKLKRLVQRHQSNNKPLVQPGIR